MRRRPIALVLLAGVMAACASSKSQTASQRTSTSVSRSAVTATTAPARCDRPVATPAVAAKVTGVASDWDLSSFDGAKIRFHWFPAPGATATHPDPTVLMGPGWGLAGDTNTSSVGVFGALNIASLQRAGYNVMTWDPRGFGKSTGTIEVDSAQYEGRDVQRLLDWAATQPGVQLDGPGDPRVGMAGGSYGGGIQFVVAAIDCRVDAITPVIAWHSLTTSLFKADTPKNGWTELLYRAAAGRRLDPHIQHARQASITTEIIDEADRLFFAQRGPADLMERVTVPTLIVQGTVDNLFTLDEGIANYRIMRERGVPAAMLWFCGGHGVCLTKAGDPTRVSRAVIAWLNRYVQRDKAVDTGPAFETIDQNGATYVANDYPVPTLKPLTASGRGALRLVADGGSGPVHPPADSKEILAGIAGSITPAKATNAVGVDITFGARAVIVGEPQLRLSYRGTTPAGERPNRVFAQLVDDATGIVVGNQVTPIQVTLDGQPHDVSVPLEAVSFTGRPGARVTLQLVATTVAYAQPRLGGNVQFDRIDIAFPVATGLRVR